VVPAGWEKPCSGAGENGQGAIPSGENKQDVTTTRKSQLWYWSRVEQKDKQSRKEKISLQQGEK